MKLRLMRGGFTVLTLLTGVSAFAQSGAKHAMTFDDLIKMHRISGADISHSGKWVAYAVSTPDMDANRGVGNIWIASTDGGKSVQLTQGGKDNSPLWSPDGRTLGFLSSRDGSSQVYLLSLEGGEPRKLTRASWLPHIAIWKR